MKSSNKKLQLNKEVISELDSIKGGAQQTTNCNSVVCNPMGPTITECPNTQFKSCMITDCIDIATIGHDGPNCLSKTDFLCWCKGI